MTGAQARAELLALPRFATDAAAYAPGLDRMRALLADLGDPHLAVPAVHVAGTNGKGSTASLCAAVLTASGRRVGLHTSPHLVDLTERIRIDGAPVGDAELGALVARARPAFARHGPSFFEAMAALAFLRFAEAGADLAVIEVGLGGRLDATNVARAAVSAVTSIGLDHTDLLGDTLGEIAIEKAGIARSGVPLVHTLAPGEARDALVAEAERRGAPVEAIRDTCRAELRDGWLALATPRRELAAPLGLAGAHQAWNAALAVRAAELAAPDLGDAAVVRGLEDVAALSGLRGRGERLGADPRVTLDVAHNADGWAAALDAAEVPPGGRLWALVGVVADKDAGALGRLLAARAARVLAVGLPGPRGRSAEALADALQSAGADAQPVGLPDALRRWGAAGSADRLLVTGSHLTVAAVLDALNRR